ncbi:MAG: MFS transporter [Ignavibacteria bacterium]|nr:MFS transporter [Ignavibacteria bacterium]
MIAIVDLVRVTRAGLLDPWQRNLLVLWFAQFIAMVGMSACIPFLPLFVRDLGVAQEDAALWSGIIPPAAPLRNVEPSYAALGKPWRQIRSEEHGRARHPWSWNCHDPDGIFQQHLDAPCAPNFPRGCQWICGFQQCLCECPDAPEKVGIALGTLQTSISAGNIMGPLVGGVISDAIGFRPVFFFVGVMCAISLVILIYKLREERVTVSSRGARVLGNVRVAWRSANIRSLLIMVMMVQTAIVMATPIFPYYLEQLGAPTSMLSTLAGIVVSIVGVCTIISAPWWGSRSDSFGFRPTMIIAGSIVGSGMLLQAIVPSYEWLFPVRTMMGLAVGALLPLMYAAELSAMPQVDVRAASWGWPAVQR